MSSDPFAPLQRATTAGHQPAKDEWQPVLPVPADAPQAPPSHHRYGKPTTTWCYRNATGQVLGYVRRFDTPEGKIFQPQTFGRRSPEAAPEWRWKGWNGKRPLYGLDRLVERPTTPVVVTEGEKAADAAAGLLPGMVAVTSPNGSKSAAKADWSPLRGRRVVIWPDADTAGLEYAQAVAKQLAGVAESAAIISPPHDVLTGWDADDARKDGWDEARAEQLVADAHAPPNGGGAEAADDGRRRRPPQRDIVIDLTERCEFWHDANRIAYVTFPVNSHHENWAVRSREFRMWLSRQFYEESDRALGSQALEDAIRILEARAVYTGKLYEPFIRTGGHAGKFYVDLCDAHWRAVEVTRNDWRVVSSVPVKFMRPASLRSMPAPEAGIMIEELRRFINVSEDEYMLIVGWLISTLRPKGPFPILVVNGEQGSGKSMACRMLRALVDPSAAAIRSVPKDDHNLIVSASNSHVLGFDNLSAVQPWLADALCRLSTGGGYATRQLHTDRDEMIFEGQRPIILNGIPLLTDRADLADRSVTIHLRAIPEDERRPEDEIAADFERAQAGLLGALLTALCAAIRNLPSTKLPRSGRMADFEKLVTAAESGLGWEHGAFQRAMRDNRLEITESAFEADSVAVAIAKLVRADHPDGLTATATELLTLLNASDLISDGVRKQRNWPQTPQGLGNRVERIMPLLRAQGFAVERRHSGVRNIIIMPPASKGETAD
jgi:putative DNA primase/helicase